MLLIVAGWGFVRHTNYEVDRITEEQLRLAQDWYNYPREVTVEQVKAARRLGAPEDPENDPGIAAYLEAHRQRMILATFGCCLGIAFLIDRRRQERRE